MLTTVVTQVLYCRGQLGYVRIMSSSLALGIGVMTSCMQRPCDGPLPHPRVPTYDLLEKAIVLLIFKKFPASRGTKLFSTVVTRDHD
jgi:hypothetical protein